MEFGFTMTIVGMGGTMLILFLISLAIDLLAKVLPYREHKKE
jgi:Na+-transporting methylmalonyl-CoA/oxaloacetate decarboxylase gamma subunit